MGVFGADGHVNGVTVLLAVLPLVLQHQDSLFTKLFRTTSCDGGRPLSCSMLHTWTFDHPARRNHVDMIQLGPR